jgi:hypothetical protein
MNAVDYNKADLPSEACEGMRAVQEEMLKNAPIVALRKGCLSRACACGSFNV